MEAALDSGAEDVITHDDGSIEILTAPTDFEQVKNALQSLQFIPEMADVTMRADNSIELAGDDAVRMRKLLDALEDLDDVQEVYHNASMDETE
jgi:transcriptional/translational regulatory protein YebC/TACO1